MSDQTTAEQTTMIHFTLDGKELTVPKGTTVYTAAKELGIDIPIFCYQDRMPPFGACRVCLVEVEKMGKLQTSCTLEATEGMVVKTQTQVAKEGRQSILEFLLINHPLDCPICDRGGECPLQDQAMKFGPGESRFYEEKRHFTKAYPLGPVLMLDRERCIVCARCTRFGEVISGDHALEFINRGFKTEVGTPDGEPVKSKFIGNTIKICPVGALTSQVYRFRARPWDNQTTESTCTLCPVGCSLFLDSRDGEIVRTRSCENKEVNDIWLCDKGWFGYEFVSSPERLQHPLIRKNGTLVQASWEEAFDLIAKNFQKSIGGKAAGFGGNTLTVEENYLFQKLIREGAKVNNVDHRIGSPVFTLEQEGLAPGMEMTIGETEDLSVIYLLGVDITEEFPVIWLRIKAALNKGARCVFIGHYAPEVATQLSQTILHAPGEEISILKQHIPSMNAVSGKAAIFVGSQYLHSADRKAILAEITSQKPAHFKLNVLEGRGNSMGARFAGMRPDLGPMDEKLSNPGLSAPEVLRQAAESGWDFLHVAGANPATQYPQKLWDAARAKLKFLVVQDIFLSETAAQADVVLPTLSYVEKLGSFINIEGRVEKLRPGKDIPKNSYSDGEIFLHLSHHLKMHLTIEPYFSHQLRPGRIPFQHKQVQATAPSQRKATGLAASFSRVLFDQGVRMKHNVHVKELVKTPHARIHPSDGAERGVKSGDKVKLTADGNFVFAFIHLDAGVSKGTIVLPLGFTELPVHNLGIQLLNGLSIDIVREA